jgi:hypothetical protein
MNKANVVQSNKSEKRVLVMGPENMRYVLEMTGKKGGKEVYVPITVLYPPSIQ